MKTFREYILSPIAVASMLLTLIASNAYAYDIEIDISPNVLNIQSKSVIVTVHTDVTYGAVDASQVFLNGVAIDWWKMDNRGNFVAKFNSDEIKSLDGLFIGDYNLLTLVGADVDGEAFIGEQEVLVIDNMPKGKN